MAAKFIGLGIEPLDNKNYLTWSEQAQSILQIKRLWKYCANKCVKEKTVDDEEKNLDAIAYIRTSVSPCQLRHLKGVATGYEAWEALRKVHLKTGPAYGMKLFTRLEQKCADVESLEEHVNNFRATADEMASNGLAIQEQVLVYMLMKTLPKEFEQFEVSMLTRQETPSLNEICSKIEEELERQKRGDGGNALPVGSGDHQAWSAKRQFRQNNRRGVCYKCRKPGHWQNECPGNRQGKTGKGKSSFLATAFRVKSGMSADWAIDSGSSSHLVCSEELLHEDRRSTNERIQVANGETATATRCGTSILKATLGDIRLKNALVLSGLSVNLLSAAKATDAGNTVVLSPSGGKIIDRSGEVIATAHKTNGQYIIDRAHDAFAVSVDKTDLWHRRLGHINFATLHKMFANGSVKGLDGVSRKDNNCKVCLKNKISELKYESAQNAAKNVLDRVHSDICGPFRTSAICGAKYFATFIDEATRMVKVYPLNNKSDIGEVFAEYKRFVENQADRKIKCVRTDNAPEYVGGKFGQVVKEAGILHQKSTAYCPQQNGLAERMNRTLVEMVRCMLNESGLPDKLWVEALQTAVYLRNRCETRVLGMSPFEAFWNIKPNIQHVRVFGCPAVALQKGGNRDKLREKGVECRLVGYSSAHKAYRLYDKSGKVIVNRSVKFIEEEPNTLIEIEDEESGAKEIIEPRRNPDRACKVKPGRDHQDPEFVKEETEKEASDTEEKNELSVPVFKIGKCVSIETPENFKEASSGPWSKYW